MDRYNELIPQGLIKGEIISGYTVNVEFTYYCYQQPEKGITLRLTAVQKVDEKENLLVQNPFEALDDIAENEKSNTDTNPFGDE